MKRTSPKAVTAETRPGRRTTDWRRAPAEVPEAVLMLREQKPAATTNLPPMTPVEFCRHVSFEPDDWQQQVLESEDRQIALLCCRQSGKSATAAVLALYEALYHPGSL